MLEKRFKKVYLEITNNCNLRCSFCPGTSRPPRLLNTEEFKKIISKIRPFTDFVYFHLMGEPLLHPNLGDFIDISAENGLKVCLTTNGTLLKEKDDLLLSRLEKIHKISISLQAKEANKQDFLGKKDYLKDCLNFGKMAQGKTIICYRLWNEGGENLENESILAYMHQEFPGEWKKNSTGFTIGSRVFLELGEKFDWPDPNAKVSSQNSYYCYGLSDQIGILCDGTVVPCCLDSEGRLKLGNIFEEELEDILNSPRAVSIYESFKNRTAAEELCRHCGYATRFVKYYKNSTVIG